MMIGRLPTKEALALRQAPPFLLTQAWRHKWTAANSHKFGGERARSF